MKKALLAIVVLVILALAGGVYYTISSLDSLVKTAIEQYGSEMTGSRVRVGSVKIELTTGKGSIKGLRIANPSGFSANDAFSLGEITVQFLPAGIRETPLVIQQVSVRTPVVRSEVDDKGRINLQVISDNLSSYSPADSQPASEEEAGDDMLIRIERFDFEDAAVTADATAAGGQETQVTVPSVNMKNVGGSKGQTGAEIGQEILTVLTTKVVKLVAAKQLDGVIDQHLEGQSGEAAKRFLKRFTK